MRRYADLDQLDLMLASTKSKSDQLQIINADRKSNQSKYHKNRRNQTSTGRICETHQ